MLRLLIIEAATYIDKSNIINDKQFIIRYLIPLSAMKKEPL